MITETRKVSSDVSLRDSPVNLIWGTIKRVIVTHVTGKTSPMPVNEKDQLVLFPRLKGSNVFRFQSVALPVIALRCKKKNLHHTERDIRISPFAGT